MAVSYVLPLNHTAIPFFRFLEFLRANSRDISEFHWLTGTGVQNRKVYNIEFPTKVSYNGCGFLGVYHIGVIKCLLDHGQKLLSHVNKFGGASAGALAAAVLCTCPEKITQSKDIVYKLATTVKKLPFGAFTPGFKLSNSVEQMIDSLLPHDAHELANNKLYISLTRKSQKKNVLKSSFLSRDDLIQCLVCSCHIPVYSGGSHLVYDGERYYDGGFTNNLVSFGDEDTIFITPFSGADSYICPQDPISLLTPKFLNQHFCINLNNIKRANHAGFPPAVRTLDKYFEQGFDDTLIYLAKLSNAFPDIFIFGPKDLKEPLKSHVMGMSKKSRVKNAAKHSTSNTK